MFIFAILCPILIWPLYVRIKKYGFNQTFYLLNSLFLYILGEAVGVYIATVFQLAISIIIFPILFILLNHLLYVIVGELSTKEEIKKRVDAEQENEDAQKAKLEYIGKITENSICIKTYIAASQQLEYLKDRDVLEKAGIKFFVKQAIITNLFVSPDDAERASELLGCPSQNI